MILAAELRVGDKFRPAYPEQETQNGRKMVNTKTYLVTKIFAQSPFFIVSVALKRQKDGIYVNSPDIPVVYSNEPEPPFELVESFPSKKRQNYPILHNLPRWGKNKPVGVKVHWNGTAPINIRISKRARAVLQTLIEGGKKEYSLTEAYDLLSEHFFDHYPNNFTMSAPMIFNKDQRFLCSLGLTELIFERIPDPK